MDKAPIHGKMEGSTMEATTQIKKMAMGSTFGLMGELILDSGTMENKQIRESTFSLMTQSSTGSGRETEE
jgi:hypothetical protein